MTKGKLTIKDIMGKLGSLLALFILGVILSIATPNFLTVSNLLNILRQTAVNSLIASGMLLTLITAGIDLSVGANCVLCTCVMGTLVNNFGMTNPVLLIIIGLATGLVIGLCNGLLLTKLHLPHPFVSTLGMKNVLCGLALLVVSSKTVAGFPDGVTALGATNLFKVPGKFSGFPLSFVVVILLFIGFHFFLNKTALGRQIFCVGGNPEATRLSGINSDNVLIFVYALCGLMSAIAGIVLVGRTGVANPASAIEPYDTDAIAACIIGGASFMGGKGTIWGTLIGAVLISTIRNGLTLLEASSDIQYIVIGLVIITAVFIDVTRGRMEAKARRLAAK
ncbi:ABC transporter permease [Caproiciproducens galactitolivorans]|uniref:Ribose transport system permease protein RbsC n=1 Tax=Caproiciproducens galactitolivorans TaxID=642589 RepID=A0A4Z0YG07_9FIRM|nr:ABC transporter permease [Caproiciproducens galactitolivorans]QEY34578.1 ABC transporter permease [Caproiciproducens galactitolivorans]TGJ77633.1 ribose transport system permease protein RbsC [Caproiciproducens galactitolivorans]